MQVKINKIGRIVLGCTLLWYGVLRGAKALVVMLKGWQLVNVNIADMTATMLLRFVIKNPLVIGIKLKGIIGDVYVHGQKIGTIEHYYDYYLSGMKAHVIPVETTIYGDVLGVTMLQNLQASIANDVEFAFVGKILVGDYGLSIPVRIERNWGDIS